MFFSLSYQCGRYVVLSAAGKGVFSTVLRARDETTHQEVAIKAIRNNDVMLRAGTKEVAILKKLQEADPTGKRHCVQFITYVYRSKNNSAFQKVFGSERRGYHSTDLRFPR